MRRYLVLTQCSILTALHFREVTTEVGSNKIATNAKVSQKQVAIIRMLHELLAISQSVQHELVCQCSRQADALMCRKA